MGLISGFMELSHAPLAVVGFVLLRVCFLVDDVVLHPRADDIVSRTVSSAELIRSIVN